MNRELDSMIFMAPLPTWDILCLDGSQLLWMPLLWRKTVKDPALQVWEIPKRLQQPGRYKIPVAPIFPEASIFHTGSTALGHLNIFKIPSRKVQIGLFTSSLLVPVSKLQQLSISIFLHSKISSSPLSQAGEAEASQKSVAFGNCFHGSSPGDSIPLQAVINYSWWMFEPILKKCWQHLSVLVAPHLSTV